MGNENTMTHKAFARLAGVSQPAVSGMVRRGKLPVDQTGRIDLNDPRTQEYLDKRRPPPEHQIGPAGVAPTSGTEDDEVARRTKKAEMGIRENKEKKSLLDLEKQKSNLIAAEIFDRTAGEFGSFCRQYILGLVDLVGDELFAIGQSGNREKFDRVFLDACDRSYKQIGNATEKAIGDLKRNA